MTMTTTTTMTTRVWLVLTNAAMMLGWLRVLLLLIFSQYDAIILRHNNSNNSCDEQLVPALRVALLISFVELFNSLAGVTRSKPEQVLLFAVIRMGVEVSVAPLLDDPSCPSAWQHLFTVFCWSLGDTVRFFCFFIDNLLADGTRWPKAVRYTVGPALFPLGFAGEMLMVVAAAAGREKRAAKLAMYGAACLWPAGFYPLFTQLLRQRRKFFQGITAKHNDSKNK